MSRWLETRPDGTYLEGIKDPNECRWLCNEVCCNDRSDCCCDCPDPVEYCGKCPLFEKED